MVTTDEIRKRVEAADRARVQSRADAGRRRSRPPIEQRTQARAQLAELEASIATQVKQSESVMSLEELAEFTGIPVAELRSTGRPAKRKLLARRRPRAVSRRGPRAGPAAPNRPHPLRRKPPSDSAAPSA